MIKCPRCGEECTREKLNMGVGYEIVVNNCSNCDTRFIFYESVLDFLSSKKPTKS